MGKKQQQIPNSLPNGLNDIDTKSGMLFGNLVELKCRTPNKEDGIIDAKKSVNGSGKPLICAAFKSHKTGKFNYLVIIPSAKTKKVKYDKNKLKSANELHFGFHGVDAPDVINYSFPDPETLLFVGFLEHIVYKVPKYSERDGVPFIHEAGDKGDDEPKAKEKAIFLISPEKNFALIWGTEQEFTDRGIIG